MLDLSNVQESSGFAPLPEGKYNVIVDDCSVKDTKSGTGQYINVKFRVLGGDKDGRFLFHMFNIKNQNAEAVKIGLGQLKTFLRIAGHKDPNVLTDVLDLVGYKAMATVKIKEDKNNISYFKAYEPQVESVKAPF